MMKDQQDKPPWLDGIEGDYLPPLIMSNEPVIRVVAGPGSSKTEGLKRRTRRLIEGEWFDSAPERTVGNMVVVSRLKPCPRLVRRERMDET